MLMASNAAAYRYFHHGLTFALALAGLLYGYNIGAMAGILIYLKHSMALSHAQLSLFAASFFWGIVCIMLLAGRLAQAIGRKKTITLGLLTLMLGLTIIVLSQQVTSMIMGRFVTGIACGMLNLAVPLYLTESLSSKHRGYGSVAFQLTLAFGVLMATWLSWHFANTHNWRAIFLLEFIPAGLLLIIIILLKESSRWLLQQGKQKAALRSLLARHLPKQAKQQLSNRLNHSKLQPFKFSFYQLFSKRYRFPLVLAIALISLNQLTGINALLQYDASLLIMAGFPSHTGALNASVWISLTNFLMTAAAFFLIERFERRHLLQLGLACMVACLLAISLTCYLLDKSLLRSHLVTIGLVGFIIAFAAAPGAMIWTLTAEILPNSIRSQGLAIALFSSAIAGALVSSFFLSLAHQIGLAGLFLLASLISLLYFFTARLLPKTNKRSLESIEHELANVRK